MMLPVAQPMPRQLFGKKFERRGEKRPRILSEPRAAVSTRQQVAKPQKRARARTATRLEPSTGWGASDSDAIRAHLKGRAAYFEMIDNIQLESDDVYTERACSPFLSLRAPNSGSITTPSAVDSPSCGGGGAVRTRARRLQPTTSSAAATFKLRSDTTGQGCDEVFISAIDENSLTPAGRAADLRRRSPMPAPAETPYCLAASTGGSGSASLVEQQPTAGIPPDMPVTLAPTRPVTPPRSDSSVVQVSEQPGTSRRPAMLHSASGGGGEPVWEYAVAPTRLAAPLSATLVTSHFASSRSATPHPMAEFSVVSEQARAVDEHGPHSITVPLQGGAGSGSCAAAAESRVHAMPSCDTAAGPVAGRDHSREEASLDIYSMLLSRARVVDQEVRRQLPTGYSFRECRSWQDTGLASLMTRFSSEDPDRIAASVSGNVQLSSRDRVVLLMRGEEAVGYAFGTGNLAGNCIVGPRLHHLFLIRELRATGLGLGLKLLRYWCEQSPPQYRAFSVNSPNGQMRRVLRRLGGRHLSAEDEKDNCGQTFAYFLLRETD